MSSVVGREREMAQLNAFLGEITVGARAAVLSGPAGIGKSTVWQAAHEAARSRGLRVLSAQPTEVETGLGFAVLSDLLTEVLEEIDHRGLPAPQREALDAALQRTPASQPPERLGIALGVHHVLREVAGQHPVLVAIDDLQWADEASVGPLEYACRRLAQDRVGLLVTLREEVDRDAAVPVVRAFDVDRRTVIRVGPLSVGAVASLVHARLGLELPRPTATRLRELSGGNPLHALELARAMSGPAWRDPSRVDLPPPLEALVSERIARLPAVAEDVVVHAAALARPTMKLLRAAIGSEPADEGVRVATAAGVLEPGPEIRFAHPLLAAEAYRRPPPQRLRDVHARLATVVADPEEQAQHLARGTAIAGTDVASRIERGADVARARGARAVAAELAERAAALTPATAVEAREDRLVRAAEDFAAAGDLGRAGNLLARVQDETPRRERRADVLARLGQLALVLGRWDEAEAHYERAAAMAVTDVRTRILIELGLAGVAFLTSRRWRERRWRAEGALRLADELGDPAVLLATIGKAARWRHMRDGDWRELIQRADALPRRESVPAWEMPEKDAASILIEEREFGEARARLETLKERAAATGDWNSVSRLLANEVWLEVEAGHWREALAVLDEARVALLQSGLGAVYWEALVYGRRALVFLGETEAAEDARAELGEAREAAVSRRLELRLQSAHLELSRGRFGAALDALCPLMVELAAHPVTIHREVAIMPLAIESLAAVGRTAEAERLVSGLERRAARSGRRWARAAAARSKALVLSAIGDHTSAVAAAEEAIDLTEGVEPVLDLARALLSAGEVRRRARSKGEARVALTRAEQLFSSIRARLWAERTRAELARVAPRRPDGAPLTETERRVAELVAGGFSNRQVADQLFMSVHTVEAHLTRVFRSLGVRTRTQLTRLALEQPERLRNVDAAG